MIEPAVMIPGLVLLVVMDLLAAAAQASLQHASLARMLAHRAASEPRANQTLSLVQSLSRTQASLSLLLTLLHFLLAGAVLALFNLQPGSSFGVSALFLTLAALLLFWLEWLVEGVIRQNPLAWAIRLTGWIRAWKFLLTPMVALPLSFFNETKSGVDSAGPVIENELKTLVDAGEEEGLLEQGERKMIYSIFNLGSTLAREIMIPRIDIIALDVKTQIPEAVEALLKSGNSRVPVFEETVDKILGLLYAKDLLRVWQRGEQLESLYSLLRPAYFIPEAKKVDELLTEIQGQRIHMAIVVDEYGGVAGLVTLEDIVEEILGEIQDEYDQGEESPYQELSGGVYVFQGRVDLDDVNEIFSSQLPIDEADTLGGFIYSRLGRAPLPGEQIQMDDLRLTVEQVIGRRIRKVRAERVPVDSQQAAGQQEKEEQTHVDAG